MAVDNGKARLAEDLASFADEMRLLVAKARDLDQRYNDTGVQAEVTALAGDGTTVPDTAFDKKTFADAMYAAALFVSWMDGGPRTSFNIAAALKE